MKRLGLFLLVLAVCFTTAGCFRDNASPGGTTVPPTVVTQGTLPPATNAPTQPTMPTTIPVSTAQPHSELYIPELSVEDVIRYFNEVCLDAEFVDSGNPTLLQKWNEPIRYQINGNPTEEDLSRLSGFADQLNDVEGFPGMREATSAEAVNLQIYFCTEQEMLNLLGDHFAGTDGGVTFWYNGANEIYLGAICCRTDLSQWVRNSVILEELYNGLGPVQDTWLRAESIIYAGYSTPQMLTRIDWLLLKLLYHPQMRCGMTAAECEAVIRQLYY